MSSTKIFMLLRTDATTSYKPVVQTAYCLSLQSEETLNSAIAWMPAHPVDATQLWAGIQRDNSSRLQIIDRSLDVDLLPELMKDFCLMEARSAIENGKGDVKLHWKWGDGSARLSVKDGAVTRYVWWDIAAVEVVGA